MIHEKLAEDFPALTIYRYDIGLDHCTLGVLYDCLGQLSEADRAYQLARDALERMIQDFPTAWTLHYNLALFLVSSRRNRFRDARRAILVARKAIEALPENVHLR